MIDAGGRGARARIRRAVLLPLQPARRLLGQTTGNSAVEFAIIAPVLVLLLCAIIEFGLAISSYFIVQEGVLAGSNYASRKGWNATAISTAVTSSSPRMSSATVSVSRFCGCPSGTTLTTISQCDTDLANPGCPSTCSTLCPDNFAARKYVTIAASLPRTKVVGKTFSLPNTISITMKAKLP